MGTGDGFGMWKPPNQGQRLALGDSLGRTGLLPFKADLNGSGGTALARGTTRGKVGA